MSVAASAQNPLTNRLPRRFYSIPISGDRLKPIFHSNFLTSRAHVWCMLNSAPSGKKTHCLNTSRWRIGAFMPAADGSPRREVPGKLSLDEVLSVAEVFCIAPSVVFSVGYVLGLVLPGTPKPFQVNLGNGFFVWQFVLLVGAVAIGVLIRRRQWQRLCRDNGASFDLIGRIEKVEEDLRSSATIVRVLSRQLEKLGIRFRVTRKGLKEPIAETAALVQKNSEATRALAVQEDILEKELGEIQKVLLAMQEQQQKQLELILAIGKAGRLIESKQDSATEEDSISKKKDAKQMEIRTGRREVANEDRT